MQTTSSPLPPNIAQIVLVQLRDNLAQREILLQTIINRFEAHYNVPLAMLEARLSQGQGQEHPDWEDSIEWRNVMDELRQARLMKSVLEWLLHSTLPSRQSSL
ncbi:MAG: hypothetical protein ACOYYU_13365 [Chloroflexota bacterium]